MAGHSQFKNIMYRKGAQDAKRAKIFAKLSREVTVAARHGIDPDMNSALRNAIQAARAQNMPKDNIERAIKRSQAADGENFEENRYEGFGPGGVSVIVETLTDNRNRTVSDVRTVFSRHGGSLGESGSVSYLFDRVGQIRFPTACANADDMFEAVIEHGGDDCSSDDDGHEVLCAADDLNEISGALQEQFGPADSVRLIWKPQTAIALDEEKAGTMFKMLDALEDNDDVQHVFANFEIDDEVLAKLSE